ncbi:alpha/beta hydrolase [Parapedomonas caeni]
MIVLPDTRMLLDQLKAMAGPKIRDLPADMARQMYRAMGQLTERPAPTLASISDVKVPTEAGPVPARLYVPLGADRPSPLLIFFHGGGWVIGDLESHHSLCAEIAQQMGLRLLSVDYRLAPEHSFPAAHDDCLAVARWVATSPKVLGAAVEGLVLAGDSAGGNLAAAVSLLLRGDASARVRAQFLIYPAVDMVEEWGSMAAFAEGFLLEKGDMDYFAASYLPKGEARADVRVSPLRADDFAGLPPTVLFVAGLDPLRDQGRAYGEKLKAAGVPLRYHEADGQIHGCFNMRLAIASAQTQLTACLGDLKALLHG